MNLSAIALSPGSKKSEARAAAFLTAQGQVSNERFQRSVFSYANGLVRLDWHRETRFFCG